MYLRAFYGLFFVLKVINPLIRSDVAKMAVSLIGDASYQRINVVSVDKKGDISDADVEEICKQIQKVSLVRRLIIRSTGKTELMKSGIQKFNQIYLCFWDRSLLSLLEKAGKQGYFTYDIDWIIILRKNESLETLKMTLEDVPFYTNSEVRVAQFDSDESRWILFEIWKIGEGGNVLDNEIGSWTTNEGLKYLNLQDKYQRRKDFQGFHIRLVTSVNKPYVTVIKNGSDYEFNEGYAVDVWNTLQEQLNFTYSLTVAQLFGAIQADGKSYNGMVGVMQRHECDVAGVLSHTTARQAVMDFTIPAHIISYGIYIKRPDLKADWDIYITSLSPEVWICYFFFFVFSVFWLWVLNKVEVIQECKTEELPYVNAFWIVFVVFMRQVTNLEPKGLSGRAFLVFVYAVNLIIYTCYSGMLTSILTTISITLPFKDLDGICQKPEWNVGVRESTATSEFLSLAQNGTSPKCVWDKNVMKTPKTNLFVSAEEGIQRLLEVNHFAFFNVKEQVKYLLLRELPLNVSENIIDTGEDITKRSYSFATQKNSPFRDIINYYISKMNDNGHLQRLQRKWWPHISQEPDVTYPSPGLREVISLIIIFYGGLAISVLLLTCELFIYSL